MSVPALQTIQLNADGPLAYEMPLLLQAAIRRARKGGVTHLLDGDKVVAEIVPALRAARLGVAGPLTSEEAEKYRINEAKRRRCFCADGPEVHNVAWHEAIDIGLGAAIETVIDGPIAETPINNEERCEYAYTSDRPGFCEALESLINEYSRENRSNTPDYLLSGFLDNCLKAFEETTKLRDRWFGVHLEPGNTYFTNTSDNDVSGNFESWLRDEIATFVDRHYPKNDTAASGGPPTPGRGETLVLLAKFVNEAFHTPADRP